MTSSIRPARLVDDADGPGRTTATLVASLTARLATLYLISGADAIGSLTAGFVALGREVAKTADGARLRNAIEAGRAGANGRSLWKTLNLDEWASSHAPSPVLDQLRNDVALLLAGDLAETLELLPIPGELAGASGTQGDEAAMFADFVVGFWAFSREVVWAVETIAAPTLPPAGSVTFAAEPAAAAEGHLLR